MASYFIIDFNDRQAVILLYMKKEPSRYQKLNYHRTKLGQIHLGDSLSVLEKIVEPNSVDLIVTSPPYGLVRKKDYGNVSSDKYVRWFRPFGELFHKILKPNGSLVIDIGGAWIPGQPTRSLYHYELLIMLCKECGFHLAQDYYWWNPAKLPTPAEWVTVRRIRVKDAVNTIWWLSKSPWPKASNRRVLAPYSDAMKSLLKNGYKAKLRPSGHNISDKFGINNGAAIPPNIIALANTESNSQYQKYCKDQGIEPHPARFPIEIPEYFIRMLTDPDDLIIDPFAGSCVAAIAAEKLKRRWICIELVEDYVKGALGRFINNGIKAPNKPKKENEPNVYKIYHPAALWNELNELPLSKDGGKSRKLRKLT